MTRATGNNASTTRGRPFEPGNPGRPKGARHRITRAAEALLDGETEALTRKAIELALAGDGMALRLCLERILPPRKERPVDIELPSLTGAEGCRGGQRSAAGGGCRRRDRAGRGHARSASCWSCICAPSRRTTWKPVWRHWRRGNDDRSGNGAARVRGREAARRDRQAAGASERPRPAGGDRGGVAASGGRGQRGRRRHAGAARCARRQAAGVLASGPDIGRPQQPGRWSPACAGLPARPSAMVRGRPMAGRAAIGGKRGRAVAEDRRLAAAWRAGHAEPPATSRGAPGRVAATGNA